MTETLFIRMLMHNYCNICTDCVPCNYCMPFDSLEPLTQKTRGMKVLMRVTVTEGMIDAPFEFCFLSRVNEIYSKLIIAIEFRVF